MEMLDDWQPTPKAKTLQPLPLDQNTEVLEDPGTDEGVPW